MRLQYSIRVGVGCEGGIMRIIIIEAETLYSLRLCDPMLRTLAVPFSVEAFMPLKKSEARASGAQNEFVELRPVGCISRAQLRLSPVKDVCPELKLEATFKHEFSASFWDDCEEIVDSVIV